MIAESFLIELYETGPMSGLFRLHLGEKLRGGRIVVSQTLSVLAVNPTVLFFQRDCQAQNFTFRQVLEVFSHNLRAAWLLFHLDLIHIVATEKAGTVMGDNRSVHFVPAVFRPSPDCYMLERISVHGARQHNLKNISVEIPRNTFTVITGLSGSGKSSLAFDTIYAEGQRRYVETLSPYARQFLDQMERPEVDSIDGLSPAISIEQKTTTRSPRSTVGTVTEIYDYLRLLYASVGVPALSTMRSRNRPAVSGADPGAGVVAASGRAHHGPCPNRPRPERRVQEGA